MNRSLSVLLPVNNIQCSLAASVGEILDVLDDLTDRFELLILENGSTDATRDVARELACLYPQVRVLRDIGQIDSRQAIFPAVSEARGDIVIAHDGRSGIDAREIVGLWRSLSGAIPAPKSMHFPRGIQAGSLAAIVGGPERRCAVGAIAPRRAPGFQLLRPGAVEELWRSVAAIQKIADQSAAAPIIDPRTTRLPRPNFLSRMKSRVRDFARGE